MIEAGAEITLKAGGSFVKIDPSGVAMGGASIKMNAGGAGGKGSGQKVQVPVRPGLVDAGGAYTEPAALATVGQRTNAQPDAQIRALQEGKALTSVCQSGESTSGDGSDV